MKTRDPRTQSANPSVGTSMHGAGAADHLSVKRQEYYRGIDKIARELAAALVESGATGSDAWDFVYEAVLDYHGGSGVPHTWPFGDESALALSKNVEAGMEDGDADIKGQTREARRALEVFYVVRFDVFERLREISPALAGE